MGDASILNNMSAVNPGDNPDDYLFQKKIEIMVDSNSKKMARDLADMKDAIMKLNDEICSLRKHINETREPVRETRAEPSRAELYPSSSSPSSPSIAAVAAGSPVAVSTSRLDSDESRKNDSNLRPRFGDYKPEDVSVNKFFYFGSKK